MSPSIHHSLHPGIYISSNEAGGSPSSHLKWYYESEIMQLPTSAAENKRFHLRVGWAHATLFRPQPSSNSIVTTSGGVGDDLYSVAFDGEHFWFGGESFKSGTPHEEEEKKKKKGKLQRQGSFSSSPVPPPNGEESSEREGGGCRRVKVGDVIGCYLDLGMQEVWFSVNGVTVPGVLRFHHLEDTVTPAISMSNSIRYVHTHTPHVALI